MNIRKVIIYIILCAVLFLPFAYMVYAYTVSYRIFSASKIVRQPLATRLYDRNSQLISELYDEYRNYSKLSEIPATLKTGFLGAEDSAFYLHTGFDIAGIGRAALADIASGELKQGGSTITQQLVKQIYAGREKSVRRKLVELFLAREFEKRYTKDEILEMYLNQIYLGHGVYGVGAAAEFYFGKQLKDVDIIEACVLAGIPSAPERYSPLRNPGLSRDRSLAILYNLITSGYIKKDEAAKRFNSFWAEYISKTKTEFPEAGVRSGRPDQAKWFTEYIRRELITKYGEEVVYRGGLKVMTTIDTRYQRYAEELFGEYIGKRNESLYNSGRKDYLKLETEFAESVMAKTSGRPQDSRDTAACVKFNREMSSAIADEMEIATLISGSDRVAGRAAGFSTSREKFFRAARVEGAVAVAEPGSGEILAMVGGSEFVQSNQLNRAVQSRRQPGSAFKVFVYGAALEAGKITAATPFYDSPLVYGAGGKAWIPSNYSRTYAGRVLARRALSFSLNTVSANIFDLVGGEKIAKYASKMTGVQYERFQLDPTLSLGTTELTPMEILQGFAVYAAGGMYIPLHGIRRIEDRLGQEMYTAAKNVPVRVIDERVAYIMTSMMRDVVDNGTASSALRRGAGFRHQAAGKTGTNSSFRDAWFIGFTPDVAAAVWVGCESPEYTLGRGESGASAAAPVWGMLMNRIYSDRPVRRFEGKPKGIGERRICQVSGRIADRGCPSRTEYFMPGTEPSEKCDGLHGKLASIKDLINRGKKAINGSSVPGLFSDTGGED